MNATSPCKEREKELFQKVPVGEDRTVTITVDKDMTKPVYVYYELENFYQNHRRYVKSRSDEQLKGDFPGASLGDCDPLKRDPITGKVLWPCGLIANSMF